MEKGLQERTGFSLEHWTAIVANAKLEKHKEIIEFLKSEHGFTYGFANFVALKSRKADAGSIDDSDLLAAQYKGKEALRPIYEEILKVVSTFGSDITITPKKDSVSLIRKRQFALVKPATKTRVDLGLKLKGKSTTERLEGSGPFGAMCTHRVKLMEKSDVDAELVSWLKEAYSAAS